MNMVLKVYSKPDVEEEYYMGKSKGAKGKKPKRNENGNVTEDASSTISADVSNLVNCISPKLFLII